MYRPAGFVGIISRETRSRCLPRFSPRLYSSPVPAETLPYQKNLERINRVYFSDPNRRLFFRRGDVILRQNEPSRRLFLIVRGDVIAYQRSNDTTDDIRYEVFRASAGSYIGVQSFFSQRYAVSSEMIAETDVELAYIDTETPALETGTYGSLVEQFTPAMLHELAMRNSRVFTSTVEKEAALKRMHRAEMSATLGQLAAGIAHELNNAVGVLARKTDFVLQFVESALAERSQELSDIFHRGLNYSAVTSSEDIRRLAREFEETYEIPSDIAKVLVRIAGSREGAKALGKKFIANLENTAPYWELGHDLHDMRVAAKHATSIVRSVKLLGGGNNIVREAGTNVHESLCEAIALLKTHLREVRLEAQIGEAQDCPTICADMTELVQIWVNITKNACDALKLAGTPDPTIKIRLQVVPTGTLRGFIAVSITDNGPGVPESLHRKIFQPDFTTKKNGLQFGLGLGLAIVRRIVDSYEGEISLESIPGKTTFRIHLPYNKK